MSTFTSFFLSSIYFHSTNAMTFPQCYSASEFCFSFSVFICKIEIAIHVLLIQGLWALTSALNSSTLKFCNLNQFYLSHIIFKWYEYTYNMQNYFTPGYHFTKWTLANFILCIFFKTSIFQKKSNSFMCWTTNTSVSSMSQQAWVQFVIHI